MQFFHVTLYIIAILQNTLFRFSSDFIFAAFIQSESELRYLVDDGVDVPFISEVSFRK